MRFECTNKKECLKEYINRFFTFLLIGVALTLTSRDPRSFIGMIVVFFVKCIEDLIVYLFIVRKFN